MTTQPTPKGAWKITFLAVSVHAGEFRRQDRGRPRRRADHDRVEARRRNSSACSAPRSSSCSRSRPSSSASSSIASPRAGCCLLMAVVWALAQFPMVGTVSFTTLLICRVILGAGEGPAFSVAAHAVYKWFPDEKRTLPTAILSQGSAFGVILAVPALNWVIVNHSWHYAFGALGVVGLMWVVAWLVLGKEGPLVQTVGDGGGGAAHSLFPASDLANLHRLLRRNLRRLLGAVAWPDLVHALHRQGVGLLAKGRRLDFGAAMGVRRHHRAAHGMDFAGDAWHAAIPPAARAACSARSPLIVGGLILAVLPHVDGAGLQIAAAGGRVRTVRIDLCGLPADARRVHAGVAARRR